MTPRRARASARRGCSRRGPNFVATMLRWRRARRVTRRRRPGRLPAYTGHLAPSWCGSPRRRDRRSRPRRRRVLLVRLRAGDLRRHGADCSVAPRAARRPGRPAPRPPTPCWARSATGAPRLPLGGGLAAYLDGRGGRHEAAGVRRGRLHRLELRPAAAARRGATRSSSSTS
jgi:hypothetical protein